MTKTHKLRTNKSATQSTKQATAQHMPPPTEGSDHEIPLEELEQRINDMRARVAQRQTELLLKANAEIIDVAKRHRVGVGITLNLPKLFDIIAYMVHHGKKEITLQFETWPDTNPDSGAISS